MPNTTDPINGWTERARAIPHRVARVLADYRRQTARINSRRDVDDTTRQKMLALAQSDARKALAPWQNEAKTATAAIETLIQRDLRPKPGTTAEELRVGAAWSRTQRLLDRAPANDRYFVLQAQLEKAAKNDDVDALRALWREAPSYMAGDGWDDRQMGDVRDTLALIAAPPEAAKAYARKAPAALGRGNLQGFLEMAESEIAGDWNYAPETLVAGYDPGETVEIPNPTPSERDEDDEASIRALMRSPSS